MTNEINWAAREAVIRLDYAKAQATAGKIEEVADALIRLNGNELEKTSLGIRNAWSGENADLFQAKLGKTKEDIQKSARDLRTTAEIIRNMARNTYNSEMEAIRVARERTYQH